jgi:hypothetical protein
VDCFGDPIVVAVVAMKIVVAAVVTMIQSNSVAM